MKEKKRKKTEAQVWSNEIKKLVKNLGSPREEKRKSAMSMLAFVDKVRAVPVLIKALGNMDLAIAATQTLSMIGAPAIPALFKALKNEDEFQVGGVLNAIEDIARKNNKIDTFIEGLPMLMGILDSNSAMGNDVCAAKVLGVIGDISTLPKLIEKAQSRNCEMRESVAWAIGEMAKKNPGHEDFETVASVLVKMLGDDQSHKHEMATTLEVFQNMPGFTDRSEKSLNSARLQAAISLRTICSGISSIETFQEMETGVHKAYQKLKLEGRGESKTRQELEFQLVKLLGDIAARKNELASKRDILLDDIPKPPKKGTIYQQMRVMKNG